MDPRRHHCLKYKAHVWDVAGGIRTYFEARFRYEQGLLASFDREALIRLRNDRQQYSGSEVEAQYARWCAERGRRTASETGSDPAVAPIENGSFSTCLLTHNYAVFGTVHGL